MKFENIIFDVDGTLWDTTQIVADSWNCAVKDTGYEAPLITAEQLKGEFGKPMDVIAMDLFPHLSDADRSALMEVCCRYEHDFLERSAENLMYPGVPEMMAELSKTHRLYIVSNCQCGYIELFLKKNSLEKYVQDIECYGNTKKSKGENICLLIGRNPGGSVCYVGDTKGDFQAAKDAGIPFIHASYGFDQVEEAPLSISSIFDLRDLTD